MIEAELLLKINKKLSAGELEQFQILNQKRLLNDISETEQSQLFSLIDKIENLNVNRLENLTELASIRNISVRELMKELQF